MRSNVSAAPDTGLRGVSRCDDLDRLCRSTFPSRGADEPGMLVVKAAGSDIRYGALGYANLETATPLSLGTRFDVGSVAKQVTCHLLRAVLGDDAALDRSLAEFLPVFGHLGPVSLRDLSDHRAAIWDYELLEALAGTSVWDPLDQPRALARVHAQPGPATAGCHYSNSHYLLLAEVARAVGGASIGDLARRLVLEPLGLHNSEFRTHHDQLVVGRACSYDTRGTGPESRRWRLADLPDVTVGPHGLYSSAMDLIRWERHVRGTTTDAALRTGSGATGASYVDGRWHLGRQRRWHTTGWLTGHSGSRFGFRTAVWTDAEGRTAVVLANRPDVDAEQVADRLLDDAAPAPRKPGRSTGAEAHRSPRPSPPDAGTPVDPPPPEGWYWSCSDGDEWRLTHADGHAVLHTAHHRLRFTPAARAAWSGVDSPLRMTFVPETARLLLSHADQHTECLVELAHVGAVEDGVAGAGPVHIDVFAHHRLGIRLTAETTAEGMYLRSGTTRRFLHRRGSHTWVGHAMLVRAAADRLTVSLPRARNLVFERL